MPFERRRLRDISDTNPNVPALPLERGGEGTAMAAHLELDSSDFRALTREEQIARCHEMAREAKRRAVDASVEKSDQYSNLAARWAELAQEMEDTR